MGLVWMGHRAGPGKAAHGHKQAGTGRPGPGEKAHGQAGPKFLGLSVWAGQVGH